ncbi:hypothetical protein SELR_pSRC102570 (plasmid) [Selenomonas ruminantium subsp. lactilytica TAM6421]|uniref:Uncharacterized protein n=1 Tax=Selenomonas ruminantium subsp. lactilytica (strain NBRC 103574 / TAM6421) TaxID=927704 RepID=I0GWC7_SELRL|nr:hypothetical protein SELR_pSRC102570 [Selenomonas ruminantium subsp. lactilytica TAM6421]
MTSQSHFLTISVRFVESFHFAGFLIVFLYQAATERNEVAVHQQFFNLFLVFAGFV